MKLAEGEAKGFRVFFLCVGLFTKIRTFHFRRSSVPPCRGPVPVSRPQQAFCTFFFLNAPWLRSPLTAEAAFVF